MALRDTPPYRADHVGSLLRPPELLAARERNDPDLRAIEDQAIRDAVQLQKDVEALQGTVARLCAQLDIPAPGNHRTPSQ